VAALELPGMNAGVTIAQPNRRLTGFEPIEVYVRGSDNQLWKLIFDGSSWDAWTRCGSLARR